MIRSMTGFGRATFEVEGVIFEVEVRSVNHRHLDVRARLPRALADLEMAVKARAQKALRRGKVDIAVAGSGAAAESELAVDDAAASQLVEAAQRLAREHGLDASLSAADVLAFPGVAKLVERELPGPALDVALAAAVDEALAGLDRMRLVEGESLEREIRGRLDSVTALVAEVEQRSGGVVEAQRRKLERRTAQLELETGLLDEARLHQEIAIAADRLDITEELVRLASHVEQFRASLESASASEPVGRRLDFLLQELGREVNTIGSKANDADVAHRVVDLKTELERIREQVQNVE